MFARPFPSLLPSDERWMRRLALACWALLLAVVAGRLLLAKTVNHTVFDIFTWAGQNWIDGKDFYANGEKLFRYSPTAAAAFAPWTFLPPRAAEILFRVLSAAAWVGGLLAFLRTCVPALDGRGRWGVVLGSLPLALMSVNNGQANILLGAFLFLALADAQRERWNRCACALAAAVLLKLWPIAAAGLLIACFPKKLGPRFAVALAAGLLAPFLMQRWGYVVEIYRSWIHYLPTDTRLDADPRYGNRDFWLLNRLAGAPLSVAQYKLLQVGSGAAFAGVLAWMRWRGRPVRELLGLVAFGGTIWMLGFGPATESCTYSLIGPLLGWAYFDPSRSEESRLERGLLFASLSLFWIALLSNMFPNSRVLGAFGIKPIGAILLFARMLIAGRPFRTTTAEPRAAPAAGHAPLRMAA